MALVLVAINQLVAVSHSACGSTLSFVLRIKDFYLIIIEKLADCTSLKS